MSELLGISPVASKGKYQFSYSYFMLLTTVDLVSNDFQTF